MLYFPGTKIEKIGFIVKSSEKIQSDVPSATRIRKSAAPCALSEIMWYFCLQTELAMDTQAVINHIIRWMDTYARDARCEGFVIGISGGIDSAVSSTLAAMTGRPTLCMTLPIHQASSHVCRAEEHVAFLKDGYPNVSSLDVDLSPAYDQLTGLLPASHDHRKLELTRANTRSRLRMISLYYMAGLNNALVVGTGNKIEDFGVGFFTKYGDGGVDISPIADLTKSEVYQLARELGVCTSIRQAPPSDGLFDGERTDEDQLGASYPELERAMEHVLRGGTAEQLSGRDREVVEIFLARHRANRHKMEAIPVCIVPAELK